MLPESSFDLQTITRDKCPVCHSGFNQHILYDKIIDKTKVGAGLKRFYDGKLPDKIYRQPFVIAQCTACLLIYTVNILSDEALSLIYNKLVPRPKYNKSQRERISRLCKRSSALIRHLSKKINPQVLDFGAGDGFWAVEALGHGYRVDAVEINETQRQSMHSRGIDAFSEIPERQYDVVYLSQVIEHLPNPRATLRSIRRQCNEGAIVILGVPNASDLGKKIEKGEDPDGRLDPLLHIQAFNLHSMDCLMQLSGFRAMRFRDGKSIFGKALIANLNNYWILNRMPRKLFICS